MPVMQNQAKTTINPEEIAKFTAMADEWWDPRGKFAPLHRINPIRIEYITGQAQPSGKTLLDIGCGGGLISEPMTKLGAKVTGIDAAEKNIRIAQAHGEGSAVKIDYRVTSAEELATSGAQYDVVLALEIVEHVDNIPLFIESISKLVKPDGTLIMSTINRTAKSYALAIVGAEYVLRWLPRGTHDWKKFVRPHELVRELEKNNMKVSNMAGLVMNPLTFAWQLSNRDLDVNYFVTCIK
jgi:2-polyprenyl-6-hydroxyphenyl methylase/3-demethylubiquinone-9 3-methyltransferase